jgi:hypothetical protein
MAIRTLARLAAVAAIAAASSGCTLSPVGVPVAPPGGIILTYQSAPLETNFEATPVGSKKGVAEVRFLREPFFTNLPLATWGDGSLEAAMREGGIQTLHYVDYEVLSVLGIYVQLTVRVSGD